MGPTIVFQLRMSSQATLMLLVWDYTLKITEKDNCTRAPGARVPRGGSGLASYAPPVHHIFKPVGVVKLPQGLGIEKGFPDRAPRWLMFRGQDMKDD